MSRLLLWDVDGTLLSNGGVSREAFFAALSFVVDEPTVDDGSVVFAGKTDPLIARELLARTPMGAALDPDGDDFFKLARRVERRLGPETADRREVMRQRGQVMPGVRELLIALRETRTTLSTVLTGNLAVNAVLKVDTFRLAPYLDMEVGAFGSDRSVRSQLVDVALERSAKLRRRYFDDDEIWMIGDTPSDLEVARAGHVRCLLVATGRHSFDELSQLGADAVVPDLTDTGAVFELLTGFALLSEEPDPDVGAPDPRGVGPGEPEDGEASEARLPAGTSGPGAGDEP